MKYTLPNGLASITTEYMEEDSFELPKTIEDLEKSLALALEIIVTSNKLGEIVAKSYSRGYQHGYNDRDNGDKWN